jgi:ribA/ribD-fused uncharacterized protein
MIDASTDETIYFYSKTMAYWGLSNFSPPGIEVGEVFWPTVEHYFQAQKFNEPEVREKIRRAPTPKEARALGQSRSLVIHPDWDSIREEVMLKALRLKFQVPKARELLLSTGERTLVESSPFDYFWACGQDGTGQNRLGQLLMLVRQELRT